MEAAIRFAIFFGVFAAVAAAEWMLPKRVPGPGRWARWRVNISILILDVVVQRLTLGAAALAAALYAEANGIGLFHLAEVPLLIAAPIGFLVLDFAVWLQHVASHRVPLFWRLHQVHHADLEVDLTTGTRFHPVEILLSALWKVVVVLALGIDPWTVIAFEAVLNAASVFSHANLGLPAGLDRLLRRVIVTPDMHRVHHSVIPAETDSNYGFFLSVWDRLFGTMVEQPAAGHAGMTIGLSEHRDPQRLGLLRLLMMPFERRKPR